MNIGAQHLMISGLGDWDPFRMSAEARGEGYLHVAELADAADALVSAPIDIVYVDAHQVYRLSGAGVKSLDVRADRLAWVSEMARAHPRKLFVIIKDDRWGGLLDSWAGADLLNVVVKDPVVESTPPAGEEDPTTFLADVVAVWRSLNNR